MKSSYFLPAVVILMISLSVTLLKAEAFGYGVLVSALNTVLYFFYYQHYRHKVATYPNQALVVVVVMMVMRFALVGGLLLAGFEYLALAAKPLLLGFVLGQLFFLINQLMVVKSYGK